MKDECKKSIGASLAAILEVCLAVEKSKSERVPSSEMTARWWEGRSRARWRGQPLVGWVERVFPVQAERTVTCFDFPRAAAMRGFLRSRAIAGGQRMAWPFWCHKIFRSERSKRAMPSGPPRMIWTGETALRKRVGKVFGMVF